MRLLIVFARAYPWRSALMLGCLLLAAVAEGLGLSSILPLLGLVTEQREGGTHGELSRTVTAVLPACAGVPVKVPVGVNVSPEGSVPSNSNVRGPEPRVLSATLAAVPSRNGGSVSVRSSGSGQGSDREAPAVDAAIERCARRIAGHAELVAGARAMVERRHQQGKRNERQDAHVNRAK